MVTKDPFEQFTEQQAEREEIWKAGYKIKNVPKQKNETQAKAGSTPLKLKVLNKEDKKW